MLIETQRILTFHGDSLQDAASMLQRQIDALPLDARVTTLTSGWDGGQCSGMAIVDLIEEASAEPGPAMDAADVTPLRAEDPLPEII